MSGVIGALLFNIRFVRLPLLAGGENVNKTVGWLRFCEITASVLLQSKSKSAVGMPGVVVSYNLLHEHRNWNGTKAVSWALEHWTGL